MIVFIDSGGYKTFYFHAGFYYDLEVTEAEQSLLLEDVSSAVWKLCILL